MCEREREGGREREKRERKIYTNKQGYTPSSNLHSRMIYDAISRLYLSSPTESEMGDEKFTADRNTSMYFNDASTSYLCISFYVIDLAIV